MIFLDTHVLLWLRAGERRLGPGTRREIDQAWRSGEVGVSSISFWEIALLQERGRIRLQGDAGPWRRELLEQGLIEIPVDGEIGIRAVGLAEFHADSADRLIVATALGGHRLVTADKRMLGWTGRLDRLNATD